MNLKHTKKMKETALFCQSVRRWWARFWRESAALKWRFLPRMLRTGCLLGLQIVMLLPRLAAQYDLPENNIWPSHYGILDFNTAGTPYIPYTTPPPFSFANPLWNIGYGHVSASVCDEEGQLLFYTNGNMVWNRNHTIMPNAHWIPPNSGPVSPYVAGSTTHTGTYGTGQNSVIIPVINEPNRYYVFSLSKFDPQQDGRKLYYSVVDMNLDNGLGDIVPDHKAIPIGNGSPILNDQLMTAIRGDDCNIWLVVMEPMQMRFLAYNITADGIDPNPVVSPANNIFTFFGPMPIELIVSPDRQKIIMPSYVGGMVSTAKATLFDFNPATGVVGNNPLSLISGGYGVACKGAAFSPDNSKVYIITTDPYDGIYYYNPHHIVQFDISLPTTADILDSRYDYSLCSFFESCNIRLGPDGKIYYASVNCADTLFYLHRFESPNASGNAAQLTPYVDQIFDTSIITFQGQQFPHAYVKVMPLDTFYTSKDTCFWQDAIALDVPDGFLYYKWDNGDEGNSRIVDGAGTYWVLYGNHCEVHVDTFKARSLTLEFSLGADTTLCNDNAFELQVSVPDASYQWQDGSNGANFFASVSGTYWLEVSKEGCTASDSIQLTFINVQQDLGQDTNLCKGAAINITLKANASGQADVLWNTGSHAPELTVTEPGIYWVTVQDPPCVGSDTIGINSNEICDCYTHIPNAFSPNGDGVNDLFYPVIETGCITAQYGFSIYNRYGERLFFTTDPEQGWDGYHRGRPVDAGTYFYEVNFKAGTQQRVFYRKGDMTLIR